jgi:hypothetical protein
MKTSTNNWFNSLKSGTIIWFGKKSIAIILKVLYQTKDLIIYDKTVKTCRALVLTKEFTVQENTLYEDINKEVGVTTQ